jgi:hypothetical protein
MSACFTFTGDIAIATSFVGDALFERLETVTGGLTANDVLGLTSISGPSLSSLESLEVNTCPMLTELSMGSGGNLFITGNIIIGGTGLANLSEFGLSSKSQTGSIRISFNPNMTADFSLGIQSATFISISNSGDNLTDQIVINPAWVRFPNLLNVEQDVVLSTTDTLTGVDMPQLTYVLGEFTITDLLSLSSIQLPELVKIGGSLNIYNNPALETLSMPALTSVGSQANEYKSSNDALFISNNSLWTAIDFPQLNTIGSLNGSNVTLSGNIARYVYS